MPLGILRLNAPHPQPSSHITFLKPLPGPTSAAAHAFLARLAALTHPILAAAHLTITSLEEHAPNGEFAGRNFNHGEVVQLVLRARGGGWLGERGVAMVLVHEVAHCVEMNHGRAFWALRDRFAGELRALWARGYTGDGLWGCGRTVAGEARSAGRGGEELLVGLPARVCGGTFRSLGRGKRKRRETGEERRRRRVERRFGVDGHALGGDEGVKVKLEQGRKTKGKPRVAGSMRGRELRAAAAMARLEGEREEGREVKGEESVLSGSETESDNEDAETMGEAFEVDGSRMRDDKGRGMVKVCEDEDQDDVHVKQELEELQGLDGVGTTSRTTEARDLTAADRTESRRAEGAGKALHQVDKDPPDRIRMEDIPQYVEKEDRSSEKNTKAVQINVRPSSHANQDTASTIASQAHNPPATARTEISEPSGMTRIKSQSTGGAEAMHAEEASTSMLQTVGVVESVGLEKTMAGPDDCRRAAAAEDSHYNVLFEDCCGRPENQA